MDKVTTAKEVFDSFEASFQDKSIIPEELELIWLEKAVARFSIEVEPIEFDSDLMMFNKKLNRYVIDTLGAFMKQSYQEREVSKVNKRISIVGKDLSIDGNNGSKTAAREELDYICFAGLRDGSTFFISTLGVKNDICSKNFIRGYKKMRSLFPNSKIVNVGGKISGMDDDIIFIPYEESFGHQPYQQLKLFNLNKINEGRQLNG